MSSYAWEGSIERSWDALVEDEHGVLRSAGAAQSRGDGRAGGDRWAAGREEGDAQGRTVCRNMIRYLCVVVDMSRAMNESDLRPTRRNAVMEVLGEFVPTFFDENPLSCMSLFACTDGLCQRLSDMSGSAKAHLGATEVLAASGEFSLQNGLDLARAALHSVPQHGSKEILVLMASLSTCDQGDVFESIDALVKKGIRCSVVGLGSAEVYVAKYATQKTKGVYGVARDRAHLRHLIMDQVQPPAVLTENRNGLRCSFVRMGFPSQRESRTQAGGVHGGVSMTRQALSNNGAGQPTITSQGFYVRGAIRSAMSSHVLAQFAAWSSLHRLTWLGPTTTCFQCLVTGLSLLLRRSCQSSARDAVRTLQTKLTERVTAISSAPSVRRICATCASLSSTKAFITARRVWREAPSV
eukprot:CAMPEP_0202037992 /NCGR_PEP_ID=MMETSP0962-20130828/4894_1 /ASSEMBLY_ACC=CAM_ASM_000488 /TAXON_ID=4773 /ORGANISM="Schizochytrium aggregatum, Strain ATCC28209" /LENGTH=409 /DNA_ID=CAMNT_0048602131 /DNA_START=176 /DNA_END=1406 /DNA_ORIENTATION=+